ncbi:class I SAM-dependent methyltransferase [Sinorhizobium alkalisoli]|uniref:Methyltransferase n=1 Tax=Sinorhizobium alkalisoli TaxID=1752398 RepID=A0A1E3VF31_9HYPH|nr:class I SAM-dependent methyltransferase [Sinorhizobium alkalisoli]MCA1493805.1 class I SAM-dependent methyltransferase [Ensifer sp. NBAIM29]MCG5479659.1 class I SAM-dependent methyltransferase [Sinorhizobium alkalisoli]ODR91496.1 methyltransferase [Sinorhizobium alkalisoli]
MTDVTLNFYEKNAEDYAAGKLAPNPRLFTFLDRCRPEGKVLELGTGGGVDAAAIVKRGFDLDATDGSSELAAIASRRIGQPVRTMLFNELNAVGIYDGVYACASLTHVPRSDLRGVIEKVYRALSESGVFWASFKAGAEEGSDALGRHYNYLSQGELATLWRAAAPWRTIETEVWLGGAYDRKPTEWVAITALR